MTGNNDKDNISLEEAVIRLNDLAQPVKESEDVDILSAVGRILAVDVYSPIDNPPFDRSPVDGYALRAEGTVNASARHPARFQVIAQINAGDYFSGTVKKGQAVRIMTGAPVPSGCDVCVRQEDTDYGEDVVCLFVPYKSDMNFCHCGEDYHAGQKLLKAGTKLGHVEISLLASMGFDKISVIRSPRIALFTTGDELMFPGSALKPGKIYNSNLFGLAARQKELGLNASMICQLPDDPEKAARAVKEAACKMDLILTTGGVSVGKKDIIHDVLKILSPSRLFWGIRMKPGMPTMASVIDQIPMISLSGNPFGALATFELLVRPVLAKICQDTSLLPVRKKGTLENEFKKYSKVRRFVRAVYYDINYQEGQHEFSAGTVHIPEGSHSSGILASMRNCNCLIDIPGGSDGLCSQSTVDIVLL